ncbi:hypothetical protein K6V98_07430 [Collinsella sp. AGMB00827]|uniref:Uncharacterized protein n=1 Tax=Collinsella ureilytica TaxID=2869515 RepID=A0ABS7MLC8_9ACTN|nr:hypothetical protein [Collinsella urealyticum]MBY4798174.1 hypothetical protein [Collinsella urealyticum]
MRDVSNTQLIYLPQFEQLGRNITSTHTVHQCEMDPAIGLGRAQAVLAGPYCCITEHSFTPLHDLELTELIPEPYVCICESSEASLTALDGFHISTHEFSHRAEASQNRTTYAFQQTEIGSQRGPLQAGKFYCSRSIVITQSFFENLHETMAKNLMRYLTRFSTVGGEKRVSVPYVMPS